MNSSEPQKPALTQDVVDLIAKTFPANEHATVSGLVRSFHWEPGPAVNERVHLDLLELSAGNLERLRELVATAQVNWRDIILAAEFDVLGDEIRQNERGKRRLAELAAKKVNPKT